VFVEGGGDAMHNGTMTIDQFKSGSS